MSERLFRAVRDFVLVRLLLYLRVFAIFLIFASPVVLVALYFAPLDHFNKAMYHIPSFALLVLSATIFYRLRWYVYFDQDPWRADPDLLELPRHLRILFGIAIVLLFIGGIFFRRLYEQAALQGGCAPRGPDDALGNAAAAKNRGAAGHQHPQHLVAALARLVDTGAFNIDRGYKDLAPGDDSIHRRPGKWRGFASDFCAKDRISSNSLATGSLVNV